LDKNRHGNTLDSVGIAASSLCAVHCILSPFIALMPVVPIRHAAGEGAQWVFVGVSIAMGITSLLPGYLRRHRHWQGLASFMVGVSFLLAAKFVTPEGSYIEGLMMIIGAVLIIIGHIVNLVLCKRCMTGKPNSAAHF
jgi:hypothetical protein